MKGSSQKHVSAVSFVVAQPISINQVIKCKKRRGVMHPSKAKCSEPTEYQSEPTLLKS